MADVTVSREDVIGFRWRRHQLDRPAGAASSATDVAILDLGVQDTGAARRRNAHDGAAWR